MLCSAVSVAARHVDGLVNFTSARDCSVPRLETGMKVEIHN